MLIFCWRYSVETKICSFHNVCLVVRLRSKSNHEIELQCSTFSRITSLQFAHRWKLTCALSDPEAITDAWESGYGDEDADEVAIWNPDEQKDEKSQLEDGRDADERLARNSTSLGVLGQQRRQDAGDAVRQHVVADVFHRQSTWYERLNTHTHRHDHYRHRHRRHRHRWGCW